VNEIRATVDKSEAIKWFHYGYRILISYESKSIKARSTDEILTASEDNGLLFIGIEV